jgi:hypothetical protein
MTLHFTIDIKIIIQLIEQYRLRNEMVRDSRCN